MKMLVSATSKHGATSAIAEEIGEARGVARAWRRRRSSRRASGGGVSSVEDYDAVVLSSAVYAGHWLQPAREVAERHAGSLAARPVWLFSSGPVGEPPKPAEDESVDVSGILEATGARGHRVFPGRLDKGALGFAEKAIVLALRVAEGDFREWDATRDWAREIAAELRPEAMAGRNDSYG